MHPDTPTIRDLVRNGTLVYAQLPPHNWRDIDAEVPLSVTLIAEDYTARTASMWNAVYEKLGMPDRSSMVVADPKNIKNIIRAFKDDMRYHGGGAGVGFKEICMPHLDELTPLAGAMGAVNVVRKAPNGRLVGHNTDGIGYALSLEHLLTAQNRSLKGARILMLGAGGTGHAIAYALAQQGAQLTILNRTEKKSEELAQFLNEYAGAQVATGGGRGRIAEVLPMQDVVISVIDDAHSPLDEYSTLGNMDMPVTAESIQKNLEHTAALLHTAKPSLIVSDIRLRAQETPMLAQARTLGFTTLDGIPMVINQGVAAFSWVYEETLREKGVAREVIENIMRDIVTIPNGVS